MCIVFFLFCTEKKTIIFLAFEQFFVYTCKAVTLIAMTREVAAGPTGT